METWQLLAWTAVLLVIWAGLTTLFGNRPDPLTLVLGAVFLMFGFYVSSIVTERLTSEDEG